MKTITREMVYRDLPWVLPIEQASFREPWDKEKFAHHWRNTSNKALVAEIEKTIVGYAVYKLRSNAIWLSRVAVTPVVRRRGVGRRLLEALMTALHPERRVRIETTVEVHDSAAWCFFRACRLRAYGIIVDRLDEDAYYLFQYALPGQELPFYTNRKRPGDMMPAVSRQPD